jgi:nitrite reductase (NADH) small subunit
VQEVFVGRAEEFERYSRKVLSHGNLEVGVFRLEDGFVAWLNECAHQGGPVCQGRLFPKVDEPIAADGTIRDLCYRDDTMHIVCPWHGYEYDVRTGANSGHPHLRLKKVEVLVREDAVYVRV